MAFLATQHITVCLDVCVLHSIHVCLLALSSTNRITSDDSVVANGHAVVPIQQLSEINEEKIDIICKYLLCTCQKCCLISIYGGMV